MIKGILQIPAAVLMFLTVIFIVLRYVKPYRDHSEFVINLLNNLSKGKEGYMMKKTQKVVTSKASNVQCREECQSMTGQIRSKARELWEQKGCIQGKDLDIWLEAERMVKACK